MDKRSLPEYAPPMYHPTPPPPTTCPPIRPAVYGPVPVATTCPSCNQCITSRVEAESSTKTHIIAVLLCGFCCCCIPYCVDSCKNKNHYCPSCGSFLGAYKH